MCVCVCVCVCLCVLTYAQMYLNDEMIKWSSLDSGVIYEFLFLCALLYFLSFLNYCVYYFCNWKKNKLIFFKKIVCSETDATLRELNLNLVYCREFHDVSGWSKFSGPKSSTFDGCI